MTGRHWDRAKERDARRAITRPERESKDNARSFASKFDGVCATCGSPFVAGAQIASLQIDAKRTHWAADNSFSPNRFASKGVTYVPGDGVTSCRHSLAT